MRPCYQLATLLLLLLVVRSGLTQETAPDFTLEGDSGPVALSDYRGKVIYLDFWASWCAPCRDSFPWMNAMQEKYASQGLEVIAINLDKERTKAKHFLEALPAGFTVAYDPEGAVAEHYQVSVMPSSYLIGRDGTVVGRHRGFHSRDEAKLEQKLIELLQ